MLFSAPSYAKSDVGYYVINHGVLHKKITLPASVYSLNFIITHNSYGIVAYTFLNVCEKIHQFLSSIKKDAHKRKTGSFFLPHGVQGGSKKVSCLCNVYHSTTAYFF